MANHEVKVERLIKKPVSEVFRALKEGRLFLNCSADSEEMKIDFRVGGKYYLNFKNHGVTNFGEFIEIIADRKIVFTWCESFEESRVPSTKVTIELFPDGKQTLLKLVHSGFSSKDVRDSHEKGWTGGINDMSEEIQSGKIRMVRVFPVPVAKLYETCTNPKTFFGILGDSEKGTYEFKIGGQYCFPTKKHEIKGEFLEIVPGKKIVFTWQSAPCGIQLTHDTKVTLLFDDEDEGGSSLELIHELLDTEELQKSHRKGWEMVTDKMSELLI
jgi:uncharacterized protein YndB with AHSA1/START domain